MEERSENRRMSGDVSNLGRGRGVSVLSGKESKNQMIGRNNHKVNITSSKLSSCIC